MFKIALYVIVIWPMSQFGQSRDEDSTYQMNEVYIESIRANRKMQTTLSTVNPKKLEAINLGQDIPTLFQTLPSVSSGSDAGNGIGYSYMNIRGMDAQRIQVNLNGVPYNDAESHEVYWVNIPDILNNADDIQVQRGIGYSTMGGVGLGGTISIKTTKKYLSPFFSYSLNTGSFNTIRNSVQASTGVLDHGWQLTARATKTNSRGFIDRASSDLISMYTNLSKYGDKISTHLIAMHGKEKTYQAWYGLSQSDYDAGQITKNTGGTDYEQKLGDPHPNQVDNYAQSHLQWITNVYWAKRHHSALTGFLTKGKGFFEEYKVGQDYSQYTTINTGTGDLIRRLWLDNLLVGVNASHRMETGILSNISAVSYHSYTGDHFGEVVEFLNQPISTSASNYYQNASNKTDLAAFNKATLDFGKSSLTLDLQLRRIGYSIAGSLADNPNFSLEKNFVFFNPKLGWNIPNNFGGLLYLFGGISHREPNRSDFILEDAINTPKPERVYDFEMGNSAKFKQVNIKTNLFVMYFQDQLIPTGALNSVGAPIRQNVKESYRAGVEGEIQIDLMKKWSFYSNQYLAVNQILDYTNLIPTYNADYTVNAAAAVIEYYKTTQIANSPSWISYAELKYSPWTNTQFQLMNKIVGSQYLDNTSSALKSLPLYSFTNFAIIQKLYPKNSLKEITLNLLLNNIFNSNYIPRGYTYNSGNQMDVNGTRTSGKDFNFYYPQAGFNVLMGIQFKL